MTTLTFNTWIFTFTQISMLIGLSSCNTFIILLFIEVNFFCFIRYLWRRGSPWDTLPKYFIIQASASAGILTCIILIKYNSSQLLLFFLSINIILKLGGFPFHSWFIELSNKLSFHPFLTLLTTQKILPLLFCSLLPTKIVLWFAIINLLSSPLIIINTNSLISLLTCSSIFYTSWILLITQHINILLLFFLAYYLRIYLLLNELLFRVNKGFILLWTLNPSNLIFKTLSCLSIIGVPPSLGFFLKIIILKLIILNWGSVAIILVISRFLFIYMYVRIILEEISLTKTSFPFKPNKFNLKLTLSILLWTPTILIILILKVSINITLYLH